jgi:hypothetical protein
MKKMLVLVLLLVSVSMTSAQLTSSVTLTPYISVTGYTLTPETLNHNAAGTLKVTIINGGNVSAEISSVSLYAPGFEVLSGKYENVGTLGPLQSLTLNFVLKAPSQDGVYIVQVWVNLVSGQAIRYPIPVKVYGSSNFYVLNTSFTEIGISETKTLTVTIGSTSTVSVKNMEAQLDPSDTSPIDPVGPSKTLIGSISDVDKFTLSYQVYVKSATVENVYYAPLTLTWSNAMDATPVSTILLIGMKVSGVKEPSLEVTKVMPSYIQPGSDFDITLILTNKGESNAAGITVIMNLTDSTISSKGPSRFYINQLVPNESSEVTLSLTSGKSSSTGMYYVPVVITYIGAAGAKTQTEVIGIKGIADMSIKSISHTPIKIGEGDSITLTIRVENVGAGNAKSTKASINIPFDGERSAFLGKIEPDEDAPAVFTLRAGGAGSYKYNISLEYEDDFGTHTVNKSAELVVFSSGISPLVPIAVIVIALLLFVIYRMRKKKTA